MDFDQIVGYKEEKEELIAYSNLIKQNKELLKYGGKFPKGIFLRGPNGVGKTKLAKAFINNANVHTTEINYSDVNTNNESSFNSYLQNKFNEAKKNAPSILFIDEVDKLCGNSLNFYAPNNFNRNVCLLNEINRCTDQDVFLLLVGNDVIELEDSILRSGRINKTIYIGKPTTEERLEIIKYYTSNSKFKDIDYDEFLNLTDKNTGADIETIISDSINKAFIKNQEFVNMDIIRESINQKYTVYRSKTQNLKKEELKKLAIHECGHAVVSNYYNKNSISKISIKSLGNSYGFTKTIPLPNTVKGVTNILNTITCSLGGYVAIEVFYKEKEIGCSQDLNKAYQNAYYLVCKEGYKGLDKITIEKEYDNPFVSNAKLEKIENAINEILTEAYNKATEIISNNRDLINELADNLVEKTELFTTDINSIFTKYNK